MCILKNIHNYTICKMKRWVWCKCLTLASGVLMPCCGVSLLGPTFRLPQLIVEESYRYCIIKYVITQARNQVSYKLKLNQLKKNFVCCFVLHLVMFCYVLDQHSRLKYLRSCAEQPMKICTFCTQRNALVILFMVIYQP